MLQPSLHVRALLVAVAGLLTAVGFAAPAQVVVVGPREETGLSFDATTKQYVAKPDEESYTFHFSVKNQSNAEIVINQVRTSCGCTVAKLPSQPWPIAPGQGGEIALVADLRGKSGTFIKTATLDMPASFKVLTIVITLPDRQPSEITMQERISGQMAAKADRQAVFKGDCATCHVEPAVGRMGSSLYLTACAICHDTPQRASAVPDLKTLKGPTDAAFWRNAVMHGKPNTMMPAFAEAEGGPLNAAQIDSLVTYLTKEFAKR